jgi:hypothetical protein
VKTTWIVLLAVTALASAASAATLTVTADKLTYTVGETITLSIYGDAEGATSNAIYGRLQFDGAFVNNNTNTQKLIGGGWVKGGLGSGDDGAGGAIDYAEAFNQVNLDGGTQTATNPISTITLIATAIGIVYVNWNTNTGSGFELTYFGLTNAPGTVFCIAETCPVPEPTTGALLALGLIALAARRRRGAAS